MEPSRRRFLALGGSAGAAALGLPALGCRKKGADSGDTGAAGATPAPGRDPEPAAWSPEGSEDAAAFAWGVQVGDATPDGVRVSVWTTAARLRLVVVRARGDEAWEAERTLEDLVPVEGRLQLELDGLEADTAYALAFYDAEGGGRSRPGRFRTALDPGGWRVVTFGATSCLGGNEPWPSLGRAAEERLDLFLLLGDTVYADGSESLEDYRLFWDQALRTGGLKDLTASTSLVATWDDHEVGNNWSPDDLAPGQLEAALKAFDESLPHRPGGGATRIWRKLSWGDVLDVFVLDCRGERAGADYISPAQLDWLLAGLADSGARFKIIMNSVPITDLSAMFGTGGASDRWDGYPAQRAEVLSFIRDQGIGGVLWVTGDVHYAQVGSVDPPGGPGEDMVEVFAGPGGSPKNPAATLFAGDPQYWWMAAEWNYVRFTCDPGTGVVRVDHVGDDGGILSSFDLSL